MAVDGLAGSNQKYQNPQKLTGVKIETQKMEEKSRKIFRSYKRKSPGVSRSLYASCCQITWEKNYFLAEPA